MKIAFISLAIVLTIAVAGGLVYRFSRPRPQSGGFGDWVKDPAYRRAAEEHFAARRALEVPEDISDAEIRSMVDRLFVEQDDDFNFDRLKLVCVKAVPFLLEALGNSRTATAYFDEEGSSFIARSPFQRICDLLEPIGPAKAAQPLGEYVDHQHKHFRQYAALALGNIGTSECIAPMLTALADKDDYVRSYAMMGIQRGMRAQRCSPEFLEAVFPALAKLLNRHDGSVSGTAPELLLAIDADQAVPVLLSPAYFTVENKELYYILRALNGVNHKIPHDQLLPLLEAVKPLIDDYPHDYVYAEALRARAIHPDASAEQTFRAELKSSSEEVQTASAEALAILAGAGHAHEVAFDAMAKLEFNELSAPQRQYIAVFLYNAEVNNGGHSQYFVNSSGDQWKAALEGLKAIGAKERTRILHEAVALFGKPGPSEDNDTRHEQLARFPQEQDESLDALDTRYYSCKENVAALLALYALDHRDSFTRRSGD